MGNISPHFNRAEFACRCRCGKDTVDVELITVLEDIRTHFNQPVILTCGNRCPKHNKAVGGSLSSQHLLSKAGDIIVKDISHDDVYNYLDNKYPDKYGIGLYPFLGFIHIDTRANKARWAE